MNNTIKNNIRTMKFICEDNFSNYVYKCIETNILYKDVSPDKDQAEIYSCGNEIDGEPCYPIDKSLKINFIDREVINKADQFNYMMLGRLKSDCDYFLGYGNRYEGHLWAKNVDEQIKEMKRIYNELSVKPKGLTLEEIENYKYKMLNNN